MNPISMVLRANMSNDHSVAYISCGIFVVYNDRVHRKHGVIRTVIESISPQYHTYPTMNLNLNLPSVRLSPLHSDALFPATPTSRPSPREGADLALAGSRGVQELRYR
jgi:hypothetical protein